MEDYHLNLLGDVFVGVKTTGIYCFSWCTAKKPKPENVVLFEARLDAENAGFRPCRTCFSALPKGVWRDEKTYVILKTPSDFSFSEVQTYLARSDLECLHKVENRSVYKLLRLQNTSFVVRVHQRLKGEIEIHFECVTVPKKSLRVEAARYVWDWFDLSTDLSSFYEMAERDDILRNLVQKYHGLRIVGINDLFESICWAVIGQQVNLPFAYTLKRRFVEAYGKHIVHEGRTYWLFPTPADIAPLDSDALTKFKFTRKKSEYIVDIANRVVSGELSKESLLSLKETDGIISVLTSIRGIGQWSANYVMMRCLRNPRAFPETDVGLHNSLKRILDFEKKPTLVQIRELARHWQGWEAYATFYLWRSLYE